MNLQHELIPLSRMKLAILVIVALLCLASGIESAETGQYPVSSVPSGPGVEGACDGKPVDSACWIELTNRPGCFVWTFVYGGDGEKVTWTGSCKDGIAQGLGTLTWYWTADGENLWAVDRGVLVDGRMHGNWLIHEPNGDEEEGPYLDGKRHGAYVIRNTNGNVSKGAMVNDEMDGEWVTRNAEGEVVEKNFYTTD